MMSQKKFKNGNQSLLTDFTITPRAENSIAAPCS
jgi:hypothetical protein